MLKRMLLFLSFNIILLLMVVQVLAATGEGAEGTEATEQTVSFASLQKAVTDKVQQQLPLVRENTFHGQLPAKFRSSRMMYVKTRANGKGEGLNILRVSGSDQFSEAEFAWIVDHVGTPITVIDLRDDAHVFVNGASVSWKDRNTYTVDELLLKGGTLSDERKMLQEMEQNILKGLQLNAKAQLPLVKMQVMTKAKTGNDKTVIMTKSSEEGMLRQYRADYFRLPLSQNNILDSTVLDEFLIYYRSLPPGTWVHFHCENGDKKTALYIMLCDILANAGTVKLDEIVARNSAVTPFIDFYKLPPWEMIGGIMQNKVDVSDYLPLTTRLSQYTRRVNIYAWKPVGEYKPFGKQADPDSIYYPSQSLKLTWVPEKVKEHKTWLESFYAYAQAAKKGYGGSWSEWQRGVGVGN